MTPGSGGFENIVVHLVHLSGMKEEDRRLNKYRQPAATYSESKTIYPDNIRGRVEARCIHPAVSTNKQKADNSITNLPTPGTSVVPAVIFS